MTDENTIHEEIWFKDLKGFIQGNNYSVFLPSQEMTFFEKLNAVMRFTVYFSIILLLLKHNYRALFLPLITALVTYILYENAMYKKKKVKKV